MIRAVGNKKLDLSDAEYNYCQELETLFGKEVFVDLFSSTSDGIVHVVTPSTQKSTPMAVVFFMLNVQMNQRLRKVDSLFEKIKKIEERLDELEK